VPEGLSNVLEGLSKVLCGRLKLLSGLLKVPSGLLKDPDCGEKLEAGRLNAGAVIAGVMTITRLVLARTTGCVEI
jgi:hypothetical protein